MPTYITFNSAVLYVIITVTMSCYQKYQVVNLLIKIGLSVLTFCSLAEQEPAKV